MGVHYGKADFITYGRPSLFLDFANKKSLTDRISGNNLITFTRTSSATYVGSDGLIKTAVANEPRFDHNPVTGESLGFLVEESRTNGILNSNTGNPEFPDANITVSTSSVGLDNTTSATQVVVSSTQIETGLRWGGWEGTTSNVRSFYVKVLSGSGAIFSGQGGLGDSYSWNISTLSYSSDARHPTGGVIPVGNGWYRCWTGPNSNTLPNTGGANFLVPINVGTYLFWGFQSETGAYPTSYIPTSGSAVTRTADVASITGTNFSSWYDQNKGTAYVETKNIKSSEFSQAVFIGFDGSGGLWDNIQEWGVRFHDSVGSTFESVIQDSSGASTQMRPSGDRRSSAKVAMALDTTSAALSINGNVSSITRTGGTMPSINSLLWHQNNDPRQSTHFSKFFYYPTRLTNTQLRNLTK